MQKLYTKIINDTKQIKPRNEIIVFHDGYCVYNPSEELLFKDGWVEYGDDQVYVKDELQESKDNLKNEILNHDSSSKINIFYINDDPLWFDKNQRSNLIQRFNAEKHEGLETTKIWYNTDEYSYEYILSINDAINILYKLEVYAANCYDVTQMHLNNIDELEDIDSVMRYDYHKGYPEPLKFNI